MEEGWSAAVAQEEKIKVQTEVKENNEYGEAKIFHFNHEFLN